MSVSNGQKANAATFNAAFISKSTPTTKGDLLARSSTDVVRVGVGTDGQVLTANSLATAGVSWADPTGGGGGSLGINYIEGGDAEDGTTGWVSGRRAILGSVNGGTDEFTATTSITFIENEPLIVYSNVNGATNGTTYYAKNAVANTTQLSATPGGAALNLTTSTGSTLISPNFRGEYVAGPTATWAVSSVTPLRGTQSFLRSKPASIATGDVQRFEFTIDAADKAKMLQIGFDYTVSSGTYVTGDLVCLIRDVTNDIIIQPSAYLIEAIGSGASTQARMTFQTSSNSVLYELIFFQRTASALANDLRFDNIQVGPQIVPLGAPVTDPVTFTPTGSWSTNTTYTGNWRRVGKFGFYDINISLSGAPTAASLTVNLPFGHVIDTAAMASTGVELTQLPGSSGGISDAGSRVSSVMVYYNSTTSVIVVADNSTTAPATVNATTPITFANTDSINIKFSVPIVGWSSSTVVSSSADTRVITGRVRNASNITLAPNNSFVKVTGLDTKVFDTAGNIDTSSSRFTASVPGYYDIIGQLITNGTNTIDATQYMLTVYKNGVLDQRGQVLECDTGDVFGLTVQSKVQLNVGEYVELFLYGEGNNSVSTITATQAMMAVELIQGPSQIAASEVIAFRAYRNTDQTGVNPNGTAVKINFDTVTSDTHGGFSTSNFRYTAPAPGHYTFQTQLFVGSTNVLNANRYEARLYVNGAVVEIFNTEVTANAAIQLQRGGCSTPLRLNAGDFVEVYFFGSGNNSVSTLSVLGGSTITYFGGYRLGGVM